MKKIVFQKPKNKYAEVWEYVFPSGLVCSIGERGARLERCGDRVQLVIDLTSLSHHSLRDELGIPEVEVLPDASTVLQALAGCDRIARSKVGL